MIIVGCKRMNDGFTSALKDTYSAVRVLQGLVVHRHCCGTDAVMEEVVVS